MMDVERIIQEIENCTYRPEYVLVSVEKNTGEHLWGEVMARNDEDMEVEMQSIGFGTDGMMSGAEFLRRYGAS